MAQVTKSKQSVWESTLFYSMPVMVILSILYMFRLMIWKSKFPTGR